MYGAFGHVSLNSVNKFDFPLNCVFENEFLSIQHYLFSNDTQVSFEQYSNEQTPIFVTVLGILIAYNLLHVWKE